MIHFETAQVMEPSGQVSADHVAVIPAGDTMVLVVADGACSSRRGAEAAAAVVRAVLDASAQRTGCTAPACLGRAAG
jgi:hypothetical protein